MDGAHVAFLGRSIRGRLSRLPRLRSRQAHVKGLMLSLLSLSFAPLYYGKVERTVTKEKAPGIFRARGYAVYLKTLLLGAHHT